MAGPNRICCVSEYCTGVLHNEHLWGIHYLMANFCSLHQKCGRAKFPGSTSISFKLEFEMAHVCLKDWQCELL